jgi:S1-C subfamily serine protease
LSITFSNFVMAQTPVWIQIETRPSLLEIEDRARAYSAKLPNINAFSLGSGWYVIAMGPFSEEIADAQRRDLQSRLAIPGDSFVTSGSSYGPQIWPSNLQSGSGVETATLAPQSGTGRTQRRIITEPLKDLSAQTDLEEETLEQARLTESQLSMPEKKNLQTALKSEGYYRSVIDGLFGQGTRSSMQAWQEDNGFEATGVLTSQQRQELLAQYNAVLEDLDLRLMTDLEAGISLKMPMGLVEFERYAPPLAHFKAKDDSAAAIYLISQAGDSKALRAIYKALGSTEIIPENGPRRLYDDSFTIRGEDRAIISFAQAELVEGSIKGFVLVWPAQQKSQQKRLLREMRQSFGVLSGALDPDLGRAYAKMPDQVYGLDTKKPIFVRSGIYVSNQGHVLTDALDLSQCGRMTLEDSFDAKILATDISGSVALLQPQTMLSPIAVAKFSRRAAGFGDPLLLAGHSFEGRLGGASVTAAKIEDLKGLGGEENKLRLSLEALPGDAGGPLLDRNGAVAGLLLATRPGARSLPDKTHHAFKAEPLKELLFNAGLIADTKLSSEPLLDIQITRAARPLAALVSCWPP